MAPALLLLPSLLAQTHATPNPPAPMSIGVLAIESNTEGHLSIDGVDKDTVSPGKVVTLSVVAGQHFVELRGSSGTKLWSEIIEVPAGQQVAKQIQAAHPNLPASKVADIPPTQELEPFEELDLTGRSLASTPCLLERKCDEIVDSLSDLAKRACDVPADSGRPSATSSREATDPLSVRIRALKMQITALQKKGCADALYQSGEQERALNNIGRAIDSMEQLKNVPDAFSAYQIGQAYATRGLIENALFDRKAAFRDLTMAIDYFTANRKQVQVQAASSNLELSATAQKLLQLPDIDRANAHLYRAVVLFRTGEYEDAFTDYNEYSALLAPNSVKNPAAAKFGESIKSRLQVQRPSGQNAMPRSIIRFVNASSVAAQIKLVGVSAQALAVPARQEITIPVAPGEYRVAVRFGTPNSFVYSRGGPFRVAETGSEHSDVTITLHKGSGDDSEARSEFEATTP